MLPAAVCVTQNNTSLLSPNWHFGYKKKKKRKPGFFLVNNEANWSEKKALQKLRTLQIFKHVKHTFPQNAII